MYKGLNGHKMQIRSVSLSSTQGMTRLQAPHVQRHHSTKPGKPYRQNAVWRQFQGSTQLCLLLIHSQSCDLLPALPALLPGCHLAKDRPTVFSTQRAQRQKDMLVT
jgi:hypothetical protein